MLAGKHILVGISGGIAAYKIPELIRLMKKAGAEVRVTTTKNALEFVTELTLRTVSGAPVYSDVFAAINEHSTEHISLPDWADVMVIAPATANVLGKMACGIADDALTTTFCATAACKPVVIAPAMNNKMYECPATRQAIATLSSWDRVTVLDCAEGELACGTSGKGRMQEPENIFTVVEYILSEKDLAGRRLVITAGPTQEKIDPVRFISNYSTGKMGCALAHRAWMRGADVTLILGPSQVPVRDLSDFPNRLQVVRVVSAYDMYAAAKEAFLDADAAVLSAAVADFAPCQTADRKIKKTAGQDSWTLEMKTTTDIAAALGQTKRADQRLVGFALETNNERDNALKKMREKHLDAIVLNSLQDAGAGFGYDTNRVTIFLADGQEKNYPLLPKEAVADIILDNLSVSLS